MSKELKFTLQRDGEIPEKETHLVINFLNRLLEGKEIYSHPEDFWVVELLETTLAHKIKVRKLGEFIDLNNSNWFFDFLLYSFLPRARKKQGFKGFETLEDFYPYFETHIKDLELGKEATKTGPPEPKPGEMC